MPKHSQSLTSSRKIWSYLSLFSVHLWAAFTSFSPHFKAAKACTNQAGLFHSSFPPSPPIPSCFSTHTCKNPFLSFARGPVDTDTSRTEPNPQQGACPSFHFGSSTGLCSLISTFHSIFQLTGLAERPPPTLYCASASPCLWDS